MATYRTIRMSFWNDPAVIHRILKENHLGTPLAKFGKRRYLTKQEGRQVP